MPRLKGIGVFSYWSKKEKEEHNTERHKLFKSEVYPFAHLPSDDFALVLAGFKTTHPSLFED